MCILSKVVMKCELIPPFHNLLELLVCPETLDRSYVCWWEDIITVGIVSA